MTKAIIFSFVALVCFSSVAVEKVRKPKNEDAKYRRKVAICVGINKYSDYKAEGKHCSDLKSAVSDAKKMAALFSECGFDEVILLLDQDATKDNIIRKIEQVKAASQKDDLLVFSYSGHGGGVMIGNSPQSYLIPFDCLAGNAVKKGISVDLLKELALTMNNRHVLFLLDCCYAGVLVADRPRKPDSMGFKEFSDFLKKRCIYALVASGVTETAVENPRDGGVFTDSVVKALNGKADTNNDGKILVIKELTYAVTKSLSENSKIAQTPRGAKLAVGDGDITLPVAGKKKSLKQAERADGKIKSAKDIEKIYADVIKSEKANEILKAQLLMTKTYIEYDELPQNQKKNDDISKYLSKLIDLTKMTFEQISKGNSDESALLYYYSQKYLELSPGQFEKASLYLNIGAYFKYRGEYQKAEHILREALELLSNSNSHTDTCKQKIALCLRLLGVVSINLYKYDTALQYFKQAIDLVNKEPKSFDPTELAKLYGAVGQAYLAAGNFKASKKWLERSLGEFKKNFKEETLDASAIYNDLGLCSLKNKDYYKALRLFKRAIAIDTKIFGNKSKYSVISYCNLGAVYLLQKDTDKALKSAKTARSIVRKYYSSGHPDIRFVDELLGRIYLEKKRYSTAEYFLKHNLAITKKCFGNHPETAAAYEWLGQLYLRKNLWRQAKKSFKEAKEIRNEYLGSNHYKTLNTESLLKQVENKETAKKD